MLSIIGAFAFMLGIVAAGTIGVVALAHRVWGAGIASAAILVLLAAGLADQVKAIEAEYQRTIEIVEGKGDDYFTAAQIVGRIVGDRQPVDG